MTGTLTSWELARNASPHSPAPPDASPRQPTEGKGWAGFTEPTAVAAVVLRHHVPGDECWALWENPNSQV